MNTPLHDKNYYDKRYAEDYRSACNGYEKARLEALELFINQYVISVANPGKVLDYGAGSGLHAPNWMTIFPQSELFFCDISTVAKEQFSQKFPSHAEHYRIISNNTADFGDATFDGVISVEVMEHVASLHDYLKDIHRILKPGGFFLWTTPCANNYSVEHLISTLFFQIEKTAEGYRRWKWEDPSHVRRLKSAEIGALLEQQGFECPQFAFRAHLFSFLCTYIWPFSRSFLKERLLGLDYKLFKTFKNGASMIGCTRKR